MGLRRLELLVQERCRSGTLTFQEALQLFHRLLTAKNRAPPILLFNNLFHAFVRMKNSNKYYATIFSLFDRLTETPRFSRSLPNVFTYTILMGYCTQINQPALGFIYFGRFIKAGLRADAFICSALLKALCSENRIHEAVNMVLNKMRKLACTPNVVSYSIIIDALCKNGEISKAFRLLDQMHLEGLVPNVFTYSQWRS
ncbi:Pentatricopeptide repeat (PPR) superfamily protein [Rhynchospora pubera]|uniref:Pentatricopeptide repeat (PPR) superfamily protein n=1 Tax=Rhynchospora pubera TaxID=906938 RepID=A0AAV8F5H3_9POAL|nr:Pentatricopeptide repeat (PPR) superfamily protein [Rhynchospora pubera]